MHELGLANCQNFLCFAKLAQEYYCNRHGYLTRHATEGRFILPKANTKVLKKPILYRTTLEWNSLPLYFVLVDSKDRVKFFLKQFRLKLQLQ